MIIWPVSKLDNLFGSSGEPVDSLVLEVAIDGESRKTDELARNYTTQFMIACCKGRIDFPKTTLPLMVRWSWDVDSGLCKEALELGQDQPVVQRVLASLIEKGYNSHSSRRGHLDENCDAR